MDGVNTTQNLRYGSWHSSAAFQNLGISMQADGIGVSDSNISIVNVFSFSIPVSAAPKGMKRKWSVIDVGSSLRLGLGSSSSSSDSKGSSMTACTTISSAKENEEESSMDIELDFSLHLGNEKLPCSEVSQGTDLNFSKAQPLVDLELSLSFGTTESTVTCISPRSMNYATDMQFQVSQNCHANDGADSIPANCGLAFSPLSTLEGNTFNFEPVCKRRIIVNDPTLTSSTSTLTTNPVTCVSGITKHQILHSGSSKTCQIEGCDKGARGASGRCIYHGGGRRCQKPGCVKGAEGRTVYCKAHGGGRRCDFLGCTKSAEGRTDFCIAHGGGRRCSTEGCTRAARGKSGLCIRHGGGKRCQKENCTKSAEGLSGVCIFHGGGRRCQYPECSKDSQGSAMFCKGHGGGKRCTYEGCSKGAEGSTPFCKGHGGGKRCSFKGGGICSKSVHGGTLFCVAHGGGKRCAVEVCIRSARGKTAYCVRHGGGKRCSVASCEKSAQGSTGFCKAHGKKCSWGHPDSEFGEMAAPCNAFARGKADLCASHSALVQDKRVHGGATLGSIVLNPKPSKFINSMEHDVMAIESVQVKASKKVPMGWGASGSSSGLNFVTEAATLPTSSRPYLFSEGRVHKGSLMSMLAGNGNVNVLGWDQRDGNLQ